MEKKKNIFKKIAHWHLRISLILFFSYLTLSVIYSPEFLLSDIRHKHRALADELIAITARVLGPPVKPVVTGEGVCSNGNLLINLNWADDEGTETFDVERDGLPLTTGLTQSQYSDTNVTIDTAYSYVITARGPMDPGIEISEPFVITTPERCEVILPEPEISITSFENKNINSYIGTPKTSQRKPNFSGTGNIANAEITFLISDSIVISASTQANFNGYWNWTVPVNLSYGTHTLFVNAADPLDPSRTASDSLIFRIFKEEDEEDRKKEKKETPVPPAGRIEPPAPEIPVKPEVEVPLDFSLTLKNNQVFQGKNLGTVLKIKKLAEDYSGTEAVVRYFVFDEKGEKKITLLENTVLERDKEIKNEIAIPKYFPGGKYSIQAEIIMNKYNVSREKNFEVLEVPVLDLGGGILVTYPELLSNLGLIASILIFLLLIWLILFSREYRLQKHALRHITEKTLEKIGLISRKKGKGVSR